MSSLPLFSQTLDDIRVLKYKKQEAVFTLKCTVDVLHMRNEMSGYLETVAEYCPTDIDDINQLCTPCFLLFFPYGTPGGLAIPQKDRNARCSHCQFYLWFLPSNNPQRLLSVHIAMRNGHDYATKLDGADCLIPWNEPDEDDEDDEDDFYEDESDAEFVDEDLFEKGEVVEDGTVGDETDED